MKSANGSGQLHDISLSSNIETGYYKQVFFAWYCFGIWGSGSIQLRLCVLRGAKMATSK